MVVPLPPLLVSRNGTLVTNKLEISIVSGTYLPGELIVGQESGAKYMVGGLQEFDVVDGFADNDTIETKGDLIVDFSETNPFGISLILKPLNSIMKLHNNV